MNCLFIADSCCIHFLFCLCLFCLPMLHVWNSRDHSELINSCFLNILSGFCGPIQPYNNYTLLDAGLRFLIPWNRHCSVHNADALKNNRIWFVCYLTTLFTSRRCGVDDRSVVRILKSWFATETEVLGGILLCPPQSPRVLNWGQTRATAVGSRLLTA
jgi:hypothetical protein